MAAAWLHNNFVTTAMLDDALSTVPVSAMPLSNLIDPQPRLRTRWTSRPVQIQVNFGAARAVGCVALLGTNIRNGLLDTVRVRISASADMSSPLWDTGSINPEGTAACNGNVVLLHASSVSGQYLRVDLAVSDVTEIDVGRLVVGPVWRLARSWAYGITEGRQVLDRRDRNPHTGAEFPVPAVFNPRATQFSLPFLSAAEAIGEWRTMLANLGATGDALWIPDDGLSQAELNARCLWGAVVQPGESAFLARANFLQYQRAFTVVERV